MEADSSTNAGESVANTDNSFINRLTKYINSPEGDSAIRRNIENMLKDQRGNNGRCTKPECKGLIITRVIGCTSWDQILSTPHCSICKKDYLFASNPQIVGHKEWNELMNKQYTI